MNFNPDDLNKFYNSELGKKCIRIIQHKLEFFLNEANVLSSLGFGYIHPYLKNKNYESKISILSVPSANNEIKFFKNGYNASIKTDEQAFPFNDLQFDTVVLSHWLEFSDRLDLVISEIWRVLKGQGKIFLIIPNSFSFWGIQETTPFGKCRPFSKNQINELLLSNGFDEIKINFCIYFPPSNNKLILDNYKIIEYLGKIMFKNFGGVMLVEATKFNYAIPKNKLKAYKYKLPKVSMQQQI